MIGAFYGDVAATPASLDELVERRYLAALPLDPLIRFLAATWTLVPPPKVGKGGSIAT